MNEYSHLVGVNREKNKMKRNKNIKMMHTHILILLAVRSKTVVAAAFLSESPSGFE